MPGRPPFGLTISSTTSPPDIGVLELAGELDISSAEQLAEAAEDLIEGGSPRIVLDLSEVAFIDSTGLRAVLALRERALQAEGAVVLANVSEAVSSLLLLTGLLDVVPTYTSAAEALAALA